MNDNEKAARPKGEESVRAAQAYAWLQTRAIVRLIIVLLMTAATLWLIYALKSVILLVVLAIFFAYLIAPIVNLFSRPFRLRGREYHFSRPLAIGLVYLIFFSFIIGLVYLMLPTLGDQLTELAHQSPDYLSALRARTQRFSSLFQHYQLPPALHEMFNNAFANVAADAGAYLRTLLVQLIGLLAYLPWLVLVPILAFFFLKDAQKFRHSLLCLLPRGRLRTGSANFFEEINNALASYIRSQLIACTIVGGICAIGFRVIGVPYALVLGIVAGLCEFIPLAGPLVVAIAVTLLTALHSLSSAAAVFLFFIVLRVMEDYVIYPRLIGKGIHLHPLAVILAILCGAELAGVAGVFLAIPVAAILAISYRHWLSYRGSDGLVAELLQPSPPPQTPPQPEPKPSRQAAD